jgi:hypothetical protein
MRSILLFLLCLCATIQASEMRLKEKLALAHEGSFLVLEQNKIFTFFHIQQKAEKTVVIEEVSIPAAVFAKNPVHWKIWFESGAPGHTCWVMSQINLESGNLEETFSFTHKGWVDMSDSKPFLTTLLNLKFQEISETERRKVGLPPAYHKADLRPLWNPRLIVNGQTIAHVPFHAYKARWPADGTELARKTVEIYLPASEEGAPYPLYFPYWLEVEGKIGSAKIRVVDSGLEARSPKEALPKRKPQLLGGPEVEKEGVRFHLKTPLYYQQFFVLAEASEPYFGNLAPVPCQSIKEEDGAVSLFISKEELKKLSPGQTSYRFAISPKEDPSIIIETEPVNLALYEQFTPLQDDSLNNSI